MKFSNEFKEALADLPSKEKDRLIVRLLKKDVLLAKRLHFELVGNRTVDQQRELVKNHLKEKIQDATDGFYSVGYLNMDVRFMSGDINEHLRITKDKFGEVELNLFMTNEILERNRENILSAHPSKAHKFCTAIVARAFKIMVSISKLHEDYFMELEGGLNKLGKLIGDNPYLMDRALYNGLDVNWLISGQIPEDIAEIQRELRSRGYLK